MKIEKNCVVSFHCDVYTPDDELVQSSKDIETVLYLHGANNMLAGLEKALDGREVGDHFEVTLKPAETYGDRDERLLQRVPIKHFKQYGKLKPGMRLRIQAESGPRDVLVAKVGRFTVDVDGNHPLAGHTLRYVIDIDEVREATSDEINHGRANRQPQ